MGVHNLVDLEHDYIGVESSGSTSDVFTYYSGGASGRVQAVVTVTYTDSTKTTIESVARGPS